MEDLDSKFGITFFSCPKSFEGKFNIIQRNAIKSWLNLNIKKEIILFGNDKGVEDMANEFKLVHIPDIKTNEKNIPIVGDIFMKANKISKYDILCFINSDIILLDDFGEKIKQILKKISNDFSKFIISGFRIDVDVDKEINFIKDKNYLLNLLSKGKITEGNDYFIFFKDTFNYFPDFIIGRFFYDNWVFYYANKNKIPFIDATDVIKILHQNHDYNFEMLKEYIYDKAIKNKDIRNNFKLAGFGSVYEYGDINYKINENFEIIPIKIKFSFIRKILKYIYLKIIFKLGECGLFGEYIYFIIRKIRNILVYFLKFK
jgi:hypothetical protein